MYIQTWQLVSRVRKIKYIGDWMYSKIQWLCRHLSGHKWSRTEWGYGGGGIDVWCRWCNHFDTIPMEEAVKIFPTLRKSIWEYGPIGEQND